MIYKICDITHVVVDVKYISYVATLPIDIVKPAFNPDVIPDPKVSVIAPDDVDALLSIVNCIVVPCAAPTCVASSVAVGIVKATAVVDDVVMLDCTCAAVSVAEAFTAVGDAFASKFLSIIVFTPVHVFVPAK
jgi:hypothetical protein